MTSVMVSGSPGLPSRAISPRSPDAQSEYHSPSLANETPVSAHTAVDEVTPRSARSNGATSVTPKARGTQATPSPRSEAFLMTGDKILRLDTKHSPSYVKVQEAHLRADVAVVGDYYEDPVGLGPDRGHVVVSKKVRHYRAASSGGLDDPQQTQHEEPDLPRHDADNQSSVTVNAMLSERLPSGGSTVSTPASEMPRLPASEPASPAHHPIRPSTSHSAGGNASPSRLSETEDLILTTIDSDQLRVREWVLKDSGIPEEGAEEREGAKRLAGRLFRLEGFHRADVAVQLAAKHGFTAAVGLEFCRLLNLGGLRIDAGLREFLLRVPLSGESSERDRILAHFSRAYVAANPHLFSSQGRRNNEKKVDLDEVHTLTCALVLLNTDLHGPNIGKRMTCREFVENLAETEVRVSKDLLKTLYQSIKTKALSPPADLAVSRTPPVKRTHTLPDPADQVDYKKGWLVRKSVVEEDGRRTPLGRRGWRMFYATVKGLVLYLHKNERGFDKKGTFAVFHNSIRLHHAIAAPYGRHTKRQNLFRLRTAGFGEFLFETSSPSEVAEWVWAINLVAASFSCPPLPAPVSSVPASAAFHRPLLPSAVSSASIQEQLGAHLRSKTEAEEQLGRLKENAPPLHGAKTPAITAYFYRERYLEEDIARYDKYIGILSEQLRKGTVALEANGGSVGDDPDEEETRDDDEDGDRLSYRAAITHQSSYESVPHS